MKRFAIWTCAALGTFMVPVSAETCAPLKIVASVDITMARGQALVPVTVAGEPLYFTIATAVPYSSISESFVVDHHFPAHHSNITFVGTSGDVMNKITTVPSFAMGRLQSDHFDLLESEMPPVPPGEIGSQGMIGADILRGYDVELNFAAGKMNLISRDHCDAMPVYWPSATIAKLPMLVTDTNKITFKMTLDGHELQAVLNTAMAGSTIKASLAKTLFDVDNASPGNTQVHPMRDGTPLYVHKFGKMSIEGLDITNPTLLLLPSKADEEIAHLRHMHAGAAHLNMDPKQQADLVLGMKELRQLHIYIDYHHQMVYFTPADPKPN